MAGRFELFYKWEGEGGSREAGRRYLNFSGVREKKAARAELKIGKCQLRCLFCATLHEICNYICSSST